MEGRVAQVSALLKEIHEWFVENLKEATSTTQMAASGSQDQASQLSDLSFELYGESHQGPKLICSHTCLHPKWNEKRSGAVTTGTNALEHIFLCQCTSHNGDAQPHQTKITGYTCKLAIRSVALDANIIDSPKYRQSVFQCD